MDHSLKVGDLVRTWIGVERKERTGKVASISIGHVVEAASYSLESPKVDVIEDVRYQIKKDRETEEEISNRPEAIINRLSAEQKIDRDFSAAGYDYSTLKGVDFFDAYDDVYGEELEDDLGEDNLLSQDIYMPTTVWVKLDPDPNATEPDYRPEIPRPCGLMRVMKLEI